MRHHRIAVPLVLLLGAALTPAIATAQAPSADLARLSLEELMRIEVTSASRKEQSVDSVPGAIHVVTAEDIRRSGMTTLPDLLRLVPGVQVAQISANGWAVSIRGFNALYSTKLLVLVDGRPIYNRLYAGVLWNSEHVVLDEIERIEVLRGPGGPMWGTNAVNGVINIVMKSPAVDQGTRVRAGGGTFDRASVTAAHGGTAGGTSYRLFTRWSSRGASRIGAESANDEAASWRGGGRIEHRTPRTVLSLDAQGGAGWDDALWLQGSFDPAQAEILRGRTDFSLGAVVGRLTRKVHTGASLQVQTSIEAITRSEIVGEYRHRAGDLDVQYHTSARRHDVVVGLAYRRLDESLDGVADITLEPSRSREAIFSAFVHDDMRIGRHVTATLGARAEKDTGFDWQVQPTARILWQVAPRQRLWGAVSRAVRMPALQERGIRVELDPLDMGLGLPVSTIYRGNPDMKPEKVVSTEVGYRAVVGLLEVDLAGFHSQYSSLRSTEAGTPALRVAPDGPILEIPVTFGNRFEARTIGAELWVRGRISNRWRAEVGTTVLGSRRTDSWSHDLANPAFDGASPRFQALARSSWSLGANDLDVLVSRVGRISSEEVPAYTRLDLRFERHLSGRLSAAVTGQHLLESAHVESRPSDALLLATEIPRSVFAELRWRIR